MKQYGKLTREEIQDDLDALADDPRFLSFCNDYMHHAVEALDFEMAISMLRLGANPDRREQWGDGYLRDLFEMFRSEGTTKGEALLAMMTLLLENGADPDFVGGCNLRAADMAMSAAYAEVANLLFAAGADRKKRRFI